MFLVIISFCDNNLDFLGHKILALTVRLTEAFRVDGRFCERGSNVNADIDP